MSPPAPDRVLRRCWLLCAALVASGSIARAWQLQAPDLALMVTLVWFGAFCCLEDRLASLRPRPDAAGFVLALSMLLLAQWRQEGLMDPSLVVLLLPLLQGIALALLLSPIRQMGFWCEPLLALALLALPRLPQWFVPDELLSLVMARLAQVLLFSFGVDASVQGPRLLLRGGAVELSGACSGSGMMAQLLVVGGLFALLFPLVPGRRRWLALAVVLAVAPLFALPANTLRIALLALINATPSPQGAWWFAFFHEGMGSLLFSLLAVTLFAPLYFRLQDRLLARQPR